MPDATPGPRTSSDGPRPGSGGAPVLGRADQPDRIRASGEHVVRQIPRADAAMSSAAPSSAAHPAPRAPVRPAVPGQGRPVPPIRVPASDVPASTRPAPGGSRPVSAPRPASPTPPPARNGGPGPSRSFPPEPPVEGIVERAPSSGDVRASNALAAAAAKGEAVPAAAALELARAFQASAEALQGIHRLHSDLAQSMRRADRSELVLQSTQALNETFRSLATVQRRLLERLDAPPSNAQRMLPLMIVALLVVFVGGIVAIVAMIDREREERVDPIAFHRELEAERVKGGKEASAASEREVAQSRKQMEALEGQLSTLQGRLDQRESELGDVQTQSRTLENQRDELAEDALRLRGETAARKAVEDELRITTQKLALLEPRQRQLEADLAEERAEKQRLQALIAQARLGIDVGPGVGEPAPGPESAVPPPASPPSVLAVSRDTRQIEMIRSASNRMLEAAAGKGDLWQLTTIRGVSADRLHDVVVLHYDDHHKLLDSVEAKELAIWVDRAGRKVEFEFRDGNLVFQGAKTPFREGSLRKVVAEGEDAVRVWLNSGLLILRTR